MYKVFHNDKLILPGSAGVDYPVSDKDTVLHGRPHPVFLHYQIKEFIHDPESRVFRFGMEMPPHEAWMLLASVCSPERAAGGFVLNADGDLLVIQRNGLWDLPKGKPHPGEDAVQTALREVQEETAVTGLRIEDVWGFTYHTFLRDNALVLKENQWFIMRCQGSPMLHPQSAEGITEARWISYKRYQQIKPGFYVSLIDVVDKGWEWLNNNSV